MQTAPAALRSNRRIDLYFGYVGFVLLIWGLFVFPRFGRKWLLSEWLISYQGGFVRRGLLGELFYLLGRFTHVQPAVFVVAANLLLYALLLFALRSLVLRSSRGWWVWALLLSPATLAFPILGFLGGFHKEILFLAALSSFVVALERRTVTAAQSGIFLGFAIPLLALSHEPLICFAPYFLGALLLAGRTVRQALFEWSIPFALGVVAAVLSARHLGNWGIAAHICSSLGYPFVPGSSVNQVCAGGAMEYLGSTGADALALVRSKIALDHFLSVYPVLAALAWAPAAAGCAALAREGRRGVPVVIGTAGAALLASLPLFLYGTDWGRWIYIHTVSIAVLLFYLDRREPSAEPAVPRIRPARKRVAWALLAVYSTLWTLTPFNENASHFGYLSLALQIAQTHQRVVGTMAKLLHPQAR